MPSPRGASPCRPGRTYCRGSLTCCGALTATTYLVTARQIDGEGDNYAEMTGRHGLTKMVNGEGKQCARW
jgi:hypothetical protein